MMVEVKRSEIYRYLGYQKIQPTQEVSELIEACLVQLQKKSKLRSTYRFTDLHWDQGILVIENMRIQSVDLMHNLKGCQSVCMMAATIGPGADQLIRRAEIKNMVEATIYQACGAAMIEAYCDAVNQEIIDIAGHQGFYCRPRFSPGYGDFSLAYQKDFGQILQMPKTIGVTLTHTLLMVPSKSVTAIIGCSKSNNSCVIQGCEVCDNATHCEFRRETGGKQ